MDISEVTTALLQRQPESNMVPTLERVERVMGMLGDPQRNYRVIHITGTNGKSSTARMIEAMIRAAGLRTGLFTSPHLHRVNERVSVDGVALSDEDFVAAYVDIEPYVAMVDQQLEIDGKPQLTFFEVLTCLALAAFADAPVDVAVIEVGLGGTWDATNVADGDVAVITPIDIDHVEWLGSDILGIAAEKAGIIKTGAVAVLAGQVEPVSEVLLERCTSVGATAILEGVNFAVRSRTLALGGQMLDIEGLSGTYPEVFLPLYGAHQAENAALAVAATEALLAPAGPLDAEVISGLTTVASPGRLEIVSRRPTVIVDAAHNPAGAAVLATALREAFSFDDAVGVVSVLQDKDAAGILAALRPVFPRVVLTANGSPRAVPVDELAGIAAGLGLWRDEQLFTAGDVPAALEKAADLAAGAEAGDQVAIVATGSVITAAEARARYRDTDAEEAPVVPTIAAGVDPELVLPYEPGSDVPDQSGDEEGSS